MTDIPKSSSYYFYDHVLIKNYCSGDNLLKSNGGVLEFLLVSSGTNLYDYAILYLDESLIV